MRLLLAGLALALALAGCKGVASSSGGGPTPAIGSQAPGARVSESGTPRVVIDRDCSKLEDGPDEYVCIKNDDSRPVASPGLVACAMFAFMSSWGEFLYALLFTATMSSKTMPIVIASFVTDVNTSPTLMNAAGVLAVVPPLVLALIFQRLIVSGIAAGAVKG